NPEQQWNLQAHEDSDEDYQDVQDEPEGGGKREHQKQCSRRETANQSNQEFDDDELRHQTLAEIARQVRTNAHRKEISTNDSGKLRDGIAEQITGKSSRNEFVNKSTGSDDEDRNQEGVSHCQVMSDE